MIKTTLNILQFSTNDVQKFLINARDEVLRHTDSKLGCVYFRQKNEGFSVLCSSEDKDLRLKSIEILQSNQGIQQIKLWKHIVQRKKAFVNNDLAADNELNKGVERDEERLKNIAAIPVFEQEKLVLVLLLANSSTAYTSESMEQLALLMEAVWKKLKNQEVVSQEDKLGKVLAGIRSVNQLIEKEPDPAMLIRKVCEKITQFFGYNTTWVLLLDEQGKYADFAYDGDIDYGQKLDMLLKNNQFTKCVKLAIESNKVVLFENKNANCDKCVALPDAENRTVMTFALRSERKLFGVMAFLLPTSFISLPREQELLLDLANDIAFALNKIQLETERRQLSNALKERIKEIECTLAVSHEIQKDQPEASFFNSLINSIKPGFMYPAELMVRVEVDGKIYGNEKFHEYKSRLLAVLSEAERPVGFIEVAYKQELGFILPEEQKLLDNIALMVSRWLEKNRAIERVKQSEENLSITLQSIGDGVLATDIQGRIKRMNNVAEKLTGYSLKKAFNKPITEIFRIINSNNREIVINPVEKVLKTGKTVEMSNHTVLISQSGQEYQISDSAAPIRNKNNEIIGVILVFSDVTAKYLQQNLIAENERKFKTFFNTAPGAVSITEIATGKYIDVNTTFETLSEYKREELIGKTSIEINIWEDVKVREKFVTKLFADKHLNNFEANFWTKSGKIIHGLLTAVITEIDGKDYIILTVIDATELFATRKNLLKSNTALSQLPTAVIITDLDFNIEYVNPIFCVLTAYKPEQLIGQPLKMLIAHNYFETHQNEIKQRLLDGKLWTDEFQNKRSDGSLYWVSANISGVYDSFAKLINFTVVEQDITKEKALHDQLVEAKEKAEASDRLKTAFMNNISHEIRTPLNSILGFGELMLNETEYSADDRKQFLNILNKSSHRLTNTITDYMDISLISSGSIEIKSKLFRLNDLIQEIYDYMFSVFEPEQIDFKLSLPQDSFIELDTDPELLKKMLVHLLTNSFKFTPNGSIEIGFEVEQKEIRVFVNDTGVGIDKSKQQEVFEFFQQENITRTRGHEGSGLGLSIVKGLADLLGFSIQMQSVKHQGTKIDLFLPYQQLEIIKGKSLTPETMKNPDQKENCILIAEDEDTNFFVLDLFLRKTLPVQTMRAFNGLDALKACRDNSNISLVLMDIKMPVMDGIEATKQIKAFRPDLVIIAVTAYALSGDEQKLLQAGCDDYIAKPVRKAELMKKINNHINMN